MQVNDGNGTINVSWNDSELVNEYQRGAVQSVSIEGIEEPYTAQHDGQSSTVSIPISETNILIPITLNFDQGVGEPLSGNLWIAKDAASLSAFETTPSVTTITSGLTPGKQYTVREISAPPGYDITDSTSHGFITGNPLTTYEFSTPWTDSRIFVSAKVRKTDALTGEALPGARFQLTGKTVDAKFYNSNGYELSSSVFLTSGADGYASTDVATDDFEPESCTHEDVTAPFTMNYCLGNHTMDCDEPSECDDSETVVVCRDCGKVKVVSIESVCATCCHEDDTI